MKAWLKKYNILTWVLSLFIAVLIWFFVVSQLNPDMDARFNNIDVQITDIEQLTANGLAIVSGGNETADVKVRGKRDKIVLLEADSFKISASVASITVPGTYNLSYNIEVPDVSIVAKTPSQISVVIDHISSKTVPASIKFNGKLPDGFVMHDYTLSPDALIVKGPSSHLDHIDQVVVNFDLSNVRKSQQKTMSYSFLNKQGSVLEVDGITVDTPAILVDTHIMQTKTVPLTVDVISEGMFAENIIDVKVNPQTIQVMGDPDVVGPLNKISVASINLRTAVLSHQQTLDFAFTLPDGLMTDDNIDTVSVSLDPDGYDYAKIVVPSDVFEPVEGYSYLTGSGITVEIFGKENVVNKVLNTDFIVKPISISDGDSGVTATVSFEVSCKHQDISVIGLYTLPVVRRSDTDTNTAE